MTWWQWVIVGLVGWAWTLAWFLAGCWWAAADHNGCQVVIGRLSSYVAWQEHRIDQLEHQQARDRFDPVAEAQQILEGGDGS